MLTTLSTEAGVLAVCYSGGSNEYTMPRRKDISNNFREATVAVHQSGEGNKAIFK